MSAPEQYVSRKDRRKQARMDKKQSKDNFYKKMGENKTTSELHQQKPQKLQKSQKYQKPPEIQSSQHSFNMKSNLTKRSKNTPAESSNKLSSYAQSQKSMLLKEIEEDDKEIAYLEKKLGQKDKKSKKKIFKEMALDNMLDMLLLAEHVDKSFKGETVDPYDKNENTLRQNARIFSSNQFDPAGREECSREESNDQSEYSETSKEESFGQNNSKSNFEEDEEEEEEKDEEEVEEEEEEEKEEEVEEEEEEKDEEEVEEEEEEVEEEEEEVEEEEEEVEEEEEDEEEEEGEDGEDKEMNEEMEEEEKVNKKINEHIQNDQQSNRKKKNFAENLTSHDNVTEKVFKKNSNNLEKNNISGNLKINFEEDEKFMEIKKNIRGLLNRVSEGSIELFLNKLLDCFSGNPKTYCFTAFAQLFVDSLSIQAMNFQSIILCEAALAVALQQIYENDFMSFIVRDIILKYKSIMSENKTLQEHEDILKNLCLAISYMFILGGINSQFILEMICNLGDSFCEEVLEAMMIIILNSASTMRKDSPATLKLLYDYLEDLHLRLKEAGKLKTRRMEFLLLDLQSIKNNQKKSINNPADKLQFLNDFIKKCVISKKGLSFKQFPTGFNDCLKNKFEHPRWWIPNFDVENAKKSVISDIIDMSHGNPLREKLNILAKKYKFNTELRKNIFFLLNVCDDYVECCEKIMKMKIPKKQYRDVAAVILECCALEKAFNKFYPLMASKLIEIEKEYRYSFQYSIWVHFKIFNQKKLRRIVNIAKFHAFLVNNSALTFASLKVIEFLKLTDAMKLYVEVFFSEFFRKDKQALIKIVKLVGGDDELSAFREGICNYLTENYGKLKKSVFLEDNLREGIKDKVKLLIKKLRIECIYNNLSCILFKFILSQTKISYFTYSWLFNFKVITEQ